jgi:polysaccharide pyruvyl transferase WcaK-like protein
MQMLASYERHKARIEVLERSYESLRRTLSTEKNCFYVGTRLHCGVASLQHGWSALIISVDNRAEEMGRDCRLPVVGRQELDKAKLWLLGKLDFGLIKIPLDQIEEWKGQFQFQNNS